MTQIDLHFSTRAERDRAYNARASVPDFEACMADYARLSEQARARCTGLFDLPYGAAKAERLDLLLPAAAQRSAPLLMFIHGGYWRAQTKENAALVAPALLAAGAAVALIEYPLLPSCTLADTVRSVRSALAWLHRHAARYGIDGQRVVAAGSSAGAHLAAMLAAPGWREDFVGLPEHPVHGLLCLSGLFDLRPLCETDVQEWLRLTPAQAWRLSPLAGVPDAPLPVVLSVGGLEPEGFQRQSAAYEAACRARGLAVRRLDMPRCNHFDLLHELGIPASPLANAALGLLGLPAAAR